MIADASGIVADLRVVVANTLLNHSGSARSSVGKSQVLPMGSIAEGTNIWFNINGTICKLDQNGNMGRGVAL